MIRFAKKGYRPPKEVTIKIKNRNIFYLSGFCQKHFLNREPRFNFVRIGWDSDSHDIILEFSHTIDSSGELLKISFQGNYATSTLYPLLLNFDELSESQICGVYRLGTSLFGPEKLEDTDRDIFRLRIGARESDRNGKSIPQSRHTQNL